METLARIHQLGLDQARQLLRRAEQAEAEDPQARSVRQWFALLVAEPPHAALAAGRRTLLEASQDEARSTPGRRTLVMSEERTEDVPRPMLAETYRAGELRELSSMGTAPDLSAFDALRCCGLHDVLVALDAMPGRRGLVQATLTAARRAVRPPMASQTGRPAPPDPGGQAMWRAAERRAAALYRRTIDGEGRFEDPVVDQALQRIGGGRALPDDVRCAMERELGVPLGRVRIHTDSVAAEAARAVCAEAFTVGEDIFFAEHAFAPETETGAKLLVHELTHVVQAWQRRTRAGRPGAWVSDPNEDLEQEANAAAERLGNRNGQRSDSDRRTTGRLKPGPDGTGGSGPATGPSRGPAESSAGAVGQSAPSLSGAATTIQRQAVRVYLVGHVSQYSFGGELHRVGDAAGPNILMDIETRPGGAIYRWYAFEAGVPMTGGPGEWSFLFGAANMFGRNEAFAQLGRQLGAAEWRRLWPNPVAELLRRHEAGTLTLADPAILVAYRGLIRSTAASNLDANERQIDELLNAPGRLARLQEYADGLREASIVRDQLVARRGEIQHSLAQAHSFTFGMAGNYGNMNPARRMQQMTELGSVEEALAGWLAAFPLLTRLRTEELNPGRIEATLQEIKQNIIVTRPRLRPDGGLDPMDLDNTRAQVGGSLGPRATAVVEAEDRRTSRWRTAGRIAMTAGAIALLFLPGGVFIDAAIGIGIAAQAWQDASVIGRAANTGLHVDDGLISQAQANAARWNAILSTVFAVVGAASAGIRVLRVSQAFMNVRRALPELELGQQAQLARALAHDPALMRTLTGPAAHGDAFILSRVRSAARELAGDPAALRRSLETTGVLARIPRQIDPSDAYEPIRAITDGSDVAAIARLTGKTPEEVAAARQHFFFEEHVLVHEGTGQLYRGRFTADPRDARIWLGAAQGRRLAADEVEHLGRLIRHESVEAGVLASQRRTIEEAFVRGELEGMLRRFLGQHMSPARVNAIMEHEVRPVMPFRYAHYVAHFSGGPNP